MPSSWTQNFYHAVFSTKNRAAIITPELEDRLYPFIGGVLRDLGCSSQIINGMSDHVHILTRYPADLSHSDMVRHVKSRSSAWIHDTFPSLNHFAWQPGYGGFTVSKSMLSTVEDYVRNQKHHHRTMTFQQELMELLRKHGIEATTAEVFKE